MGLNPQETQILLDRQKSRPEPAPARRKAPTPKEREIQRAILDFLKTVPGVVAWKTGGGMFRLSYKGKERVVRMGQRGISDIIGWIEVARCVRCKGRVGCTACRFPLAEHHARFLAVEVKRPGQWPTEEQNLFLASVHQAGGIAVLARSVHDVALALGLAPRGSHASSTSGPGASGGGAP